MNWLERLARRERKHRRAVINRNVRAYRRRQSDAGMRRIDLALSAEDYQFVKTAMLPGETISAAFARLLGSITGNRKSA
jgi:hypothetical protein